MFASPTGSKPAPACTRTAHGVIDERLPISGEELPPDWALQDPDDYLESLGTAVRLAVSSSRVDPEAIVAIATDFTACTMVPTLVDGTPLSQLPEFKDRPHAYAKLWRHHAAQPQADRINAIAAARDEPWLSRYGGLISSEWEFAKGLELLENDGEIYRAMERWVEAADWIVWQLCGRYVRNTCTAGYKGIRQDGVYPSAAYLAELNPAFAGFVTEKLDQPVGALGEPAGTLTALAAARLGLREGIVVAVGNVDAHVTAPAARAVEPGRLVAIMGTSTCHVVNSNTLRDVPGMCGVVDGGIVAGSWGYEAGQSGVGDLFAWCANYGVPIEYVQAAAAAGIDLHDHLSNLAAAQQVGQHGLLALDWHNGNRSVLVNHELSGVVLGLTVNTRPEDVYRALVEATAFGARTIVDTLRRAWRSRRRVHRCRRLDEELDGDADLRRRPSATALPDRLRTRARIGISDPCRGRRGRLPRCRHGLGSDGLVAPRRVRTCTRPPPTATTGCSPNTPNFTITSVAAVPMSCTGSSGFAARR